MQFQLRKSVQTDLLYNRAQVFKSLMISCCHARHCRRRNSCCRVVLVALNFVGFSQLFELCVYNCDARCGRRGVGVIQAARLFCSPRVDVDFNSGDVTWIRPIWQSARLDHWLRLTAFNPKQVVDHLCWRASPPAFYFNVDRWAAETELECAHRSWRVKHHLCAQRLFQT